MSSIDPYRPPKATVVRVEEKPSLGLKEYAVLALVLLQVVLSVRFGLTISEVSSPEALNVLGMGYLLGTALCVGIMVLGGVLTIRRGRSPTYIFVIAAVLSFLLMLQWRQGFATVCAVISLCTSVVSAWNMSWAADEDPPPPEP